MAAATAAGVAAGVTDICARLVCDVVAMPLSHAACNFREGSTSGLQGKLPIHGVATKLNRGPHLEHDARITTFGYSCQYQPEGADMRSANSVELDNVQFLSVVMRRQSSRRHYWPLQDVMSSVVTQIPVSVVDGWLCTCCWFMERSGVKFV